MHMYMYAYVYSIRNLMAPISTESLTYGQACVRPEQATLRDPLAFKYPQM